MAAKLKKGPKLVLAMIIASALLYFGYTWAQGAGYINGRKVQASQTIQKVDLPTAPANAASAAPFVALPTNDQTTISGPEVRAEIWAWNSQLGFIYANGGATTTKGSIMEKNKVRVRITRQDDVPTMQQNLVKFASALKNGNPQPTEGVHFVAIMGDASAQFLQAVNAELSKLGDEYIAQVIYSCGKSYGEDQFMGLPEWKANPQSARGSVISTVIRDGDWNIVIKWASDNGIPINSDERTYDPDAINFVAANDYVDAAQKYIQNYTETRPVVNKGKPTGESKQIAINGVSTWTPADVQVASGRGGLVRIISTKEYDAQMPNALIGIKKWMESNRTTVESMIRAIGEGGDQVKSYSAALEKGGELSAKVYGEKDGPYWVKYYKGTTEPDKQGLQVQLGGSRVFNIADNMNVFGLANGSVNTFEIVYRTFGDVVMKLYPEVLPNYPDPKDVINTSFLSNVASNTNVLASAEEHKFDNSDITQTVSNRSWSIEFQTGKADFSPAALNTLNELFDQLVIASNLKIKIGGHTDDVGNDEFNMSLSRLRAEAVKTWLTNKSTSAFPAGRIIVEAYGETKPLVPNTSDYNRAKNRRVEITLGQ